MHKESKEHIRKLCQDREQKISSLNECAQQGGILRKEAEAFRAKAAEKEAEAEQVRRVAGSSGCFWRMRQRYGIEEMDVSCCAILFCKAIELQVKECFYEGFKKQLSEFQIRGKIPFCMVKRKGTTIGTYCHVLHNNDNKQNLVKCMAGLEETRYDIAWWNQFDIKLDECRVLRNNCCHCDQFTWKQMNRLLVLLFLKAGNSMDTVVDGVIMESEVGKRLLSFTCI